MDRKAHLKFIYQAAASAHLISPHLRFHLSLDFALFTLSSVYTAFERAPSQVSFIRLQIDTVVPPVQIGATPPRIHKE